MGESGNRQGDGGIGDRQDEWGRRGRVGIGWRSGVGGGDSGDIQVEEWGRRGERGDRQGEWGGKGEWG